MSSREDGVIPLHPEIEEAAAAVLDAVNQPQEFKRRLLALIRNDADDGVGDTDVAGVVAAADTDADTGH